MTHKEPFTTSRCDRLALSHRWRGARSQIVWLSRTAGAVLVRSAVRPESPKAEDDWEWGGSGGAGREEKERVPGGEGQTGRPHQMAMMCREWRPF